MTIAEAFSTYTFTDADGDRLIISRPADPASGTPSVAIRTGWGEPVHVPHADVPAVIVALGHAAGITPTPDPAADLSVYQLRCGTNAEPDVIATYATTQAAAAHGEHAYQAAHGHAEALEWRPTGSDGAPRWRLTAVDIDGTETETDWHIVPGMIPVSFKPGCGES